MSVYVYVWFSDIFMREDAKWLPFTFSTRRHELPVGWEELQQETLDRQSA